MPCDFTVISAVRQRFGDASPDLGEIAEEQEAPFVGPSKDYTFACPNVIRGQHAVLQFETLAVTTGARDGIARNILRINGVDIPGGITPGGMEKDNGRRFPYWKAHFLTVPPNVLRQTGNVLHIESVRVIFTNLDNFIVDNIVVFFKTNASRVVGPFAETATSRRALSKRVPSKNAPGKRASGKKKRN